MMWIDARLPLRFGPFSSRNEDDAVLTEAEIGQVGPAAGHVMDCNCCTPRSAAAQALAKLFRERAVGRGAPFRGVLAVVGPAAEAGIREALATDPVASARFRLG